MLCLAQPSKAFQTIATYDYDLPHHSGPKKSAATQQRRTYIKSVQRKGMPAIVSHAGQSKTKAQTHSTRRWSNRRRPRRAASRPDSISQSSPARSDTRQRRSEFQPQYLCRPHHSRGERKRKRDSLVRKLAITAGMVLACGRQKICISRQPRASKRCDAAGQAPSRTPDCDILIVTGRGQKPARWADLYGSNPLLAWMLPNNDRCRLVRIPKHYCAVSIACH